MCLSCARIRLQWNVLGENVLLDLVLGFNWQFRVSDDFTWPRFGFSPLLTRRIPKLQHCRHSVYHKRLHLEINTLMKTNTAGIWYLIIASGLLTNTHTYVYMYKYTMCMFLDLMFSQTKCFFFFSYILIRRLEYNILHTMLCVSCSVALTQSGAGDAFKLVFTEA